MVRPNDPFRARHYAILLLFLARLRQSFGSAPFTGLPGPSSLRERRLVGLTRFELVTPRLSSVCSNQLSYRPPSIYFSPLSTFRRACFTIPRHENLSKNRYRSGSLKTRQDVFAQLCRRSISGAAYAVPADTHVRSIFRFAFATLERR